MFSPAFVEEMKQKLLAAQKQLTDELSGMSPHTEMGSEEEENANEVEVDEVSQDVMARINADLVKIKNALAKIEAGTYGTDDEGKEISEDRLRVIPWADSAI